MNACMGIISTPPTTAHSNESFVLYSYFYSYLPTLTHSLTSLPHGYINPVHTSPVPIAAVGLV